MQKISFSVFSGKILLCFFSFSASENKCSLYKLAEYLFAKVVSLAEYPVFGQITIRYISSLCPIGADNWCGYNKNLKVVKNISINIPFLSRFFFFATIKGFRYLGTKEVLWKCIHGGTQNPNEYFNNCVWEWIPKNTFVCIDILKTGVMDVICFNEGVFIWIAVLNWMPWV